MQTFLLALRAVVYGGAFLSLWGWAAFSVRRFDGHLVLPGWMQWPGFVLLIAGSGLMIAGVGVFVWHGRGTAAPFDPPRHFVARGPYRFVRNPMYLGALAALLGLSFWFRSLAMVLFVIVPATGASLFVRLVEEPRLETRFGDTYRAYTREVRRWWPRWPRRG